MQRKRNRARWVLIGVLIVALMPGCSRRATRHNFSAPTEVAKVRVTADAKVYLNDRIITLVELKKEFQRLKQVNGGIWLVDESTAGESRQQAQAVRQAIIRTELPMMVR
jgi:hypothetical protein